MPRSLYTAEELGLTKYSPKKGHRPIYDLRNRKFNKLTAIKPIIIRGKRTLWLCQCDCGKKIKIMANYLYSHNTKSCGCLPKGGRFAGIGDMSLSYYNALRRGAETRSYEFHVSLDYLWNLYLQQDKKCKLTKIPINFIRGYQSGAKIKQTASLDRINNNKGYIIGNVRWVHKHVNLMKHKLSDEDFLHYCALIAKYNPVNINDN